MLVFLAIAMLAIPASLIWVIGSIIFAPACDRTIAIILAYDRLANATTGGNGHETISSRIGRMQLSGYPMPLWARLVGGLLDKLQPNHCKDSVGV